MGKRELFIALAFVAVGVLAYQVTAPPAKPDEQGFSLSNLWSRARRGMRANIFQGQFTHTGTIPVSGTVKELRLDGLMGRLKIVGEPRADVSYELAVESTGPDRETASGFARQVTLRNDDLGTAMALHVTYPRGGRQAAVLTLRVPARLSLLLADVTGLEVAHVAAAHLDGVLGDSTVSDVPGPLTGTHRNGALKASRVQSVKMTLQRSRASFDHVEGGLALDVRDGECHIADSKGPVDIDETRVEITVVNQNGLVRISGSDGRVTLTNPDAESKVDVRRAEVNALLARAVPLTLLTTDNTLRLVLEGPPAISIDAVANLGHVQAPDFDLTPESVEQESRLTHAFGAGASARVSLRNLRGDIVIKKSQEAIVNPIRK